MKKFTLAAVSVTLLVQPITAEAQFGMLGHQFGGGNASAGPSPDLFLANSILSTKNVMIAAAVLA